MKRYSLRNTGKNILIAGMTLAALLSGTKEARAEDYLSGPRLEEKVSGREYEKQEIIKQPSKFSPKIDINLRDPRKDSEANTKIKNSLINLLGEPIGSLGKKTEDSVEQPYLKKVPRFIELGLHALNSTFFEVISHEYGHYRAGEKTGAENIHAHIGFPLLERSWCRYGNLNDDSLNGKLERTIGGPNQDSINILNSFTNSQVNKNELYNSVDRIITHLGQNIYLQKSKEGIDDYKKIERILNEKGYDISLNEMRKNNTALNFLNPTNWRDTYNLLKFLKEGKRDLDNIQIGQGNLKFGLPSLSHFFTVDGELATLTEFIKYKKTPIEFSFSRDLDFTQEKAGVNIIRIGGKLYEVPLTNRVNISPYVNLNFGRSNLNSNGANVGTEIEMKISDNFSLTGKLEYNKDDILESRIKGKDNGVYATAGIKLFY